MRKISFLLMSLGFVSIFFFGNVVRADIDSHGSFGMRPGDFNCTDWWLVYDVTSGTKVKDSVLVQNLSDSEITLSLDAVDAYNDTVNPDIFLMKSSGEVKNHIGKWIVLEQTSLTLAPREEREVGFTLDVPKEGVVTGDRFIGAVVASSSPAVQPNDGFGVAIGISIGQRVYVNIVEESQVNVKTASQPMYYVVPVAVVVLIGGMLFLQRKR